MENSPAQKGGLKVGDVIINMNGEPILTSGDLPHLVGVLKPGSKANLEVIRDGERRNVTITIGTLPGDDELMAASGNPDTQQSSNRLGVTVAELTDEQKKAMELEQGVVINEVRNGPAARIGLRRGDVITHLNNRAIDSVKTFQEVAEDLPKNRSVSMRVLRQGRASFITFELSQ